MRTLTFALSALTLLAAGAADARSIVINKAPVRDFIQNKLVKPNASKLTLTNKLDAKDRGVSPKARLKATQALNGLERFGNGTGGGNYVVKMGAKKLVITTGKDTNWYGGMATEGGNMKLQRFIARNAKSGTVVARGNVHGGAITWTRMKNEHSKKTPSERNAAQ